MKHLLEDNKKNLIQVGDLRHSEINDCISANKRDTGTFELYNICIRFTIT